MTRTSLSLRQSLPARRTGYPADIGLVARRALAPPGTPTPCASEVIGGVPCVIVGESRGDATVVHLHGGGYRMGCARDWAGFGNELSRSTGARVILPEYSLAPEHPFPGAIHDVIGLIGALVGADEEKPILLSGDSAGGGLALAVATGIGLTVTVALDILLIPAHHAVGAAVASTAAYLVTDLMLIGVLLRLTRPPRAVHPFPRTTSVRSAP